MAEKDGGKSETPAVDVGALQARIQELETHKNTWMGKATEYEKKFQGVDPDEYHSLKASVEQLQREKAIADPKQMDAWKADTEKLVRSTVQKQLDDAIARAKSLESENKELKVVDRAFKDIADEFNSDCFDEVKQYVRRFGDVDEKGNLIFKDENGAIRYAQGSTSKQMDAKEFGAWIGSLKPSWKKPTHVRGTDTGNQTKSAGANGATITAKDFMQLPQAEQRALALKMSASQLSDIGKEVSRLTLG